MDISKLLSAANIPKSLWPNCHITEDGMIFTPVFDDAGAMTKTGVKAYEDWLAAKDHQPVTTPSTQDVINANIMARLAALEGDNNV